MGQPVAIDHQGLVPQGLPDDPGVVFNLKGRRALVTGSASGIGLATAELLARSGAHVAMNDLTTQTLESAVGRLKIEGFAVDAVPGDLSVSARARDVALKAVE